MTIRLRVVTDVVEHGPVNVAPDPVDPFDAVAVLGRVQFGTVPERYCGGRAEVPTISTVRRPGIPLPPGERLSVDLSQMRPAA